jgi:hypothetical protein
MSVVEKQPKSQDEREALKSLRSAWKKDMQAKYGEDWRKYAHETVAIWRAAN